MQFANTWLFESITFSPVTLSTTTPPIVPAVTPKCPALTPPYAGRHLARRCGSSNPTLTSRVENIPVSMTSIGNPDMFSGIAASMAGVSDST